MRLLSRTARALPDEPDASATPDALPPEPILVDVPPHEPPPPGRTAEVRVVLGVGTLVALLLGLAGAALGLQGVRVVALYVFCVIGIGAAPWQLNPWIRLPARLTLSMLTSFVTLVLVSSAMILTPTWHPLIAMTVVGLVAVPLHLLGLQRAVRDLGTRSAAIEGGPEDGRAASWSWNLPALGSGTVAAPARPRRLDDLPGWLRPRAQVLAALLGLVLCLLAALTHQHLMPGFGGFPRQIGAVWFVGLALVVCSIALGRGADERQLAISVTALVVVLTLTPALVYDGPRSQSAAKHVDLVNQIRSLRVLDTHLGVYNAWPGFFSATAWICDVVGISDPMVLARFWPALIAPFRLFALRYLFGKIARSPYQAWVAVALAVLADPLGADYFSPQSLGFVLALSIFALALAPTRSRTRLLVILAAGCALAVTHQLSPYMVGGGLVVLVFFRQVRPWWTPALVLGPAVAWVATHLSDVSSFLYISDFGNAANFRPPKTTASTGLDRLPIVSQTVDSYAAMLLIVGLLALVTIWLEMRGHWLRRLVRWKLHPREQRAWSMAVVPVVGVAVIAVNPYGQEGIFRAILFATPWLVALAAQLFGPTDRLRQRLPLLGVSVVLAALFLVAAFGMDRTNVIRTGDLRALQYFSEQGSGQGAGPQILLQLGKGDLPTPLGTASDTQHQLVSRDTLEVPVQQEVSYDPAAQVDLITAKMLDYAGSSGSNARLYVIWSPISSSYDWAYGIQSPEQFAQLRDAFAANRLWQTVFSEDGTVVLRYGSVS